MSATPTEVATWHAISAQEVVERLGSNTGKGLDASAASMRLKEHGPNRLPEGRQRGPLMRFFAQFNNILVYVLLGAGFVKHLWVDAGIIFAVVILNALLGFIQVSARS
jgi:magnesium-transporting ATPase (P-type)